jgi:hypothetical protein
MKTVVYTSRIAATETDPDALLAAIVHRSRVNNQAAGITGAMIHQDGQIIQVIEGDDNAIDQLYSKICNDPRHTDITEFYQQPISQRSFKQWSLQGLTVNVEESFSVETIQLVSDLFDTRFVFRSDLYLNMIEAVFTRPEFMQRLTRKAA